MSRKHRHGAGRTGRGPTQERPVPSKSFRYLWALPDPRPLPTQSRGFDAGRVNRDGTIRIYARGQGEATRLERECSRLMTLAPRDVREAIKTETNN